MTADEIARILDALGQRLGPTGDYVFALAVRQVYIDAIVSVAFLAPALVALVVVARRLHAALQTAPDESADPVFWYFIATGLVGAVVVTAAAMTMLSVPSVLNAEYAALRDILGAIR